MKVLIKNEQGEYLTLRQGKPAFDSRKERAIAYDLERDAVADQILAARKLYGTRWEWEEVGNAHVVDELPPPARN